MKTPKAKIANAEIWKAFDSMAKTANARRTQPTTFQIFKYGWDAAIRASRPRRGK